MITAAPRPALSLTIRGTSYAVAPLPLADPDDINAFTLRRADGTGPAHAILQNCRTGLACDCGDFVWRHADRGTLCKHLKAAVAVRLLEPVPPLRSPR